MQYRVEELAAATGVGVDTVRFYQSRSLLPRPRRRGRIALYDDAHAARIRRIRALLDQGFTLAQIQRLLDGGGVRGADRSLLQALEAESREGRRFTRAELAAEAGLPEALVAGAQAAGLLEPTTIAGEERFGEADLRMARSALAILEAGLPLDELLRLALRHAQGVREVCDRAIDLFDDRVRKTEGAADDPEAVTRAFRELLPQVTRLVALHFQRTLVDRALERLRASGDDDALRHALAAVESGRLEVAWR